MSHTDARCVDLASIKLVWQRLCLLVTWFKLEKFRNQNKSGS